MTTPMAQRKTKLPEANKMARMLRAGRTARDLAERYRVNTSEVVARLTANGWDPSNGAWVGGEKKDHRTDAPISARGGGAGRSGHHVGGGDNPNVVFTVPRPFTQRHRPTGFAWPATDIAPVIVPAPAAVKRRRPYEPSGPSRKLNAEQETELVKRYLDGESSIALAHDYQINDRTVRKYLTRLGVPLRDRSEALRVHREKQREATMLAATAFLKGMV